MRTKAKILTVGLIIVAGFSINLSGSRSTVSAQINYGYYNYLQPTVNLDADDTNISYGDSTYIRWSSRNATSCSATGGANGWVGPRNTSGSFYTGNLYDTKTYNIRCTNNSGLQTSESLTIYVDEDSNNEKPRVTTYGASDIQNDSATLNGYVDTNGSSVRKWFEWDTRSGSLSNRTNKSSYSSSSRDFEDTIYNLDSNTTYYFRAVAENSNGDISYGRKLSFRTDNDNRNYDYDNNGCDHGNCAPTAITTLASNVGQTSARLNGLGLSLDPLYSTQYFEWGATPSLGITTLNRNISREELSPFFESLFSLTSGTIYYYRAVTTNRYGTSHGDITSFRTLSPSVIIDNPPVAYRNTTVVTNTRSGVGASQTSLVFFSVNQDEKTVRRGSIIEYAVNYKNTSSRDLRDVVLRISIPKELEFIETSRGYFGDENSAVVTNIDDLNSQEEGSVLVTVKVTNDVEINKIFVVTANLAYTIVDNGNQEEVFAYAKSMVENGSNVELGALAFLFGDGFLPKSLLGWLLLILLLSLVILTVRKAYRGNGGMMVAPPEDLNKIHH